MNTKYITSNPHILGGQPVITGTRVLISRILFLLKAGYTLEAIHDDYPHVPVSTLAGALDEVIKLVEQSSNVSKISQA